METIFRGEYPRPQMVRDEWENLNGVWEFSFEDESYDRKIVVPFVYQSKLSGIHTTKAHDSIWYRRRFQVPRRWKGKRIILHFGAVDYFCKVWVNNILAASHEGGHVDFSCDITEMIDGQDNELRIQVRDDLQDLEIPRGKQYWKEQSESIFYTASSGIWQPVWMEAVEQTYIDNIWVTPDLDNKCVELLYQVTGGDNADLEVEISIFGTVVSRVEVKECRKSGIIKIGLDQQAMGKWNFQEELAWSPEYPRLFDLKLALKKDERILDTVSSYFGMRKISIENGHIMLNNRYYYQRLILDQGYWPDSLLTAAEDGDFVRDIEAVKAMGFNGVRMHQKIEDPRFLYHADRLGLLVWEEMPAAYIYSRNSAERLMREWRAAIMRDYNHPCIIAWVPLNESWGVPDIKGSKCQQAHSVSMAYLTRSLDQSRLVISNDGWEHTASDVLTIHDYEQDRQRILRRYKSLEDCLEAAPAGRPLFAEGWKYEGQPVMVTELGGIACRKEGQDGWGYSVAGSAEDFLAQYERIIHAFGASPVIQGFCYTQLTDVEQEINGLLTFDREPKVPLTEIRNINNKNR